jgi:hypothetical protein
MSTLWGHTASKRARILALSGIPSQALALLKPIYIRDTNMVFIK